jgi:hypothetical protein
MKIKVGVGHLVQMTEDGQAQIGYLMVEQLRGRMTMCAVYIIHKETRSVDFLV